MTIDQFSEWVPTLASGIAWDVRLLCVCAAVVCVLISVELCVKLIRALYPVALSAFAAGAAFGLLAAMLLGVV